MGAQVSVRMVRECHLWRWGASRESALWMRDGAM